MQVENVIAFAVDQEPAGLEIRINFGVFAGRDATSAELEELGKLLVSEAGEISIVGEERHEISEDAEVVLRQVRVSVSPENVPDDRGGAQGSSASGSSRWRRSGRASASTSATPS